VEQFNKLSTPEKAIVIGGVVMFIASFFDWWGFSEGGFSFGESGWGRPASIWSILAILLSIALAGLVLAMRLGNVQMPKLPEGVTWGKVFGGAGIALIVLMLLKFWRILEVPAGGPDIGFYLGVIAAAVIVYGCYMIYSEERSTSTTS